MTAELLAPAAEAERRQAEFLATVFTGDDHHIYDALQMVARWNA